MNPNLFADERYDLEPRAVHERLQRGEVQVVDVREPHEWDAGRIPGARHVVIDRLAMQAPTIDRDKPVVFHCRLGYRAAMCAHAFRSIGFEAYNLGGGIDAWHRHGLPMEPAGGEVAGH